MKPETQPMFWMDADEVTILVEVEQVGSLSYQVDIGISDTSVSNLVIRGGGG